MAEDGEKTPPTPSSSASCNDVEKGENIKILEVEEDNEPLEKAKEKAPPGINASLVLLYAVFFTMFTTGWINLNSCPVNRLIPIYLIVAGFVGALAKFLSKTDNKFIYNFAIALVVLDIFWHGVGTYVVYKEYQPNYDPDLGIYCNRTAYLLSFWILTFQYTLLGIFIMLSGCYLLMNEDFKKC
ncbi:transmembrane protein 272-like [Diorhabda sublineata]|uniref:transmembrane protein 272-like n=1 Tax=Diorhabda sublineata TaxID=1163346 RepID=UPI0024E0AD5D|nr:transmembrane protein 272-like [Diorhabda sublineata]